MASVKTDQHKALLQNILYQQDKINVHGGNISRDKIAGESANTIEPFKLMVNKNSGSHLKVTHSSHLTASSSESLSAHKIRKVKDGDRSMTGNNIHPEQDLMEINEAVTKMQGSYTGLKNINHRLKSAYSFSGR